MNKYNLEVIGNPVEFGNINFLENFQFSNNIPFPGSYKEFVKKIWLWYNFRSNFYLHSNG